MAAAEGEYGKALGAAHARETELTNLRGTRSRLQASQRAVEEEKAKLTSERDDINLIGRQADWGESDEAARRHLLALDDIQQRRTTAEWNEEACQGLNDAVRLCFPDSTRAEEMSAEVRELLIDQRWQRGGLDVRVRLTPALLRALRTHLNLTEQHDGYQQTQISTQRTERHADLATARLGLTEAEQTSQAHRASLALGIKSMLRQVAHAFDELDQAYGGYGAGLDYPEPEAPAEPDRPWQWTVAPKWRRAEGQRMGSYNLKANTAQIDEKAAKLVCAAALATGGDRPLVLILDELGRNLGKQHRRASCSCAHETRRLHGHRIGQAHGSPMTFTRLHHAGSSLTLRPSPRSSRSCPESGGRSHHSTTTGNQQVLVTQRDLIGQASVAAFAGARGWPAAHARQQRGRHGHARDAHAGGLGTAIRDEPPRPLRSPPPDCTSRSRAGPARPAHSSW